MPWCTSLTALILLTSRATTTATTNPTWLGTNFLRTMQRSWPGSTNGFTGSKIMRPMFVSLGRSILIDSSLNQCSRLRSITGGIDERSHLHRFGNDDRGGSAHAERSAHRLCRGRFAEHCL